jgi:hypothetical protein
MPRKAQIEPAGPGVSDPPPPGHWAQDRPVPGYLAYGFDCLAEDAGMADGLSLLLGTCGITIGQADAAAAWQFREWYYACYREHSGKPAAGGWDVVAPGGGIFSPGSGWDLVRR